MPMMKIIYARKAPTDPLCNVKTGTVFLHEDQVYMKLAKGETAEEHSLIWDASETNRSLCANLSSGHLELLNPKELVTQVPATVTVEN